MAGQLCLRDPRTSGWPRPTCTYGTSRRPALPLLRELPGPARLVNARGRVAASTDPGQLAGALAKGPDFASVLATGRPDAFGRLRLAPCRGVPLVLVAGGR